MRTVTQPAEINGPNNSQGSHGAGNRSQSPQLEWGDILLQASGRVLRKASPLSGLTRALHDRGLMRALHDQSPVCTGGRPVRALVTPEARPGWSARSQAVGRPSCSRPFSSVRPARFSCLWPLCLLPLGLTEVLYG